jgi:hypothetical protein
MKTAIHRWSGQYWGYIYNGRLFDANSNYRGWVDNDNRVWRENGRYLGEVVENNYILRRKNIIEPMPRIPRIPPIPPIPPIPKIDKIGKIPRIGMIDPLV